MGFVDSFKYTVSHIAKVFEANEAVLLRMCAVSSVSISNDMLNIVLYEKQIYNTGSYMCITLFPLITTSFSMTQHDLDLSMNHFLLGVVQRLQLG